MEKTYKKTALDTLIMFGHKINCYAVAKVGCNTYKNLTQIDMDCGVLFLRLVAYH